MRLRVVYYMPGEEVMRKGDLSRELCFVLHGACHLMEDDKVQRVVRHDVRARPPSVKPPHKNISFLAHAGVLICCVSTVRRCRTWRPSWGRSPSSSVSRSR
jgi:hypothetical protein